jgi:carbon storage regulator
MLILTRRTDEKIKIGEDIVVSILDIEGGTVKIGIDAPRHITILRAEMLEKIQQENIASSGREVEEITEAAALIKRKLSGE